MSRENEDFPWLPPYRTMVSRPLSPAKARADAASSSLEIRTRYRAGPPTSNESKAAKGSFPHMSILFEIRVVIYNDIDKLYNYDVLDIR
ncbi:MAG: hypothetical protein VB050_10690 [Geobacteraceae bacterium]|nr:hypothetical protein [Geobacteraceae bacterium]